MSLVGTIASDDESFGIFLDPSTKAALRLKVGDDYQGWKLRAIQGREVTMEKDQQAAVLSLPQPGGPVGRRGPPDADEPRASAGGDATMRLAAKSCKISGNSETSLLRNDRQQQAERQKGTERQGRLAGHALSGQLQAARRGERRQAAIRSSVGIPAMPIHGAGGGEKLDVAETETLDFSPGEI